jgi:hypothetical protein
MGIFQEVKKKKPEEKQPDMVGHIQKFAQAEIERKKKLDAEKAKDKSKVDTSPSQGILSRVYDYVMGSDKEKKKK